MAVGRAVWGGSGVCVPVVITSVPSMMTAITSPIEADTATIA